MKFKKTPLFYDISCYSEVFLYFCKKTVKRLDSEIDEDVSTFIEVYETWLKGRKKYLLNHRNIIHA